YRICPACLGACYSWINNHQKLFFPNQSGWRFIGFPLMIVVMRHFAEASARRRAIAFGAAAVFALLWNVETGIAVLLALLVYLAGRARVKWVAGMTFRNEEGANQCTSTESCLVLAGRDCPRERLSL